MNRRGTIGFDTLPRHAKTCQATKEKVILQTTPTLTSSGWWFGTWILWRSIQLGMSSSQLTNSYFSEGLKPPTRYLSIFSICFFSQMCSYFSMFSWAKCFWTMFDFAAESTNLRNPEPHLWQASATSGAWGLETLASLRILAVFVGCVSHEFHRGSSGIIGARWDLGVTRFFWTQRLEACVIYCISTSFCGEFAQTVHFRDSCWPS